MGSEDPAYNQIIDSYISAIGNEKTFAWDLAVAIRSKLVSAHFINREGFEIYLSNKIYGKSKQIRRS